MLQIYCDDLYDGVQIVNVFNPADPEDVGFYDTAGYVESINAVGNVVYVADGPGGLVILAMTTTHGDIDGNGGVDLQDWAEYADCASDTSPPSSCVVFDFDDDGDVDLRDFGMFQAAFGD